MRHAVPSCDSPYLPPSVPWGPLASIMRAKRPFPPTALVGIPGQVARSTLLSVGGRPVSKGLGSMQTRLLDALLDRQDSANELARWLVRAGYGEVMELFDEDGWEPVAAL